MERKYALRTYWVIKRFTVRAVGFMAVLISLAAGPQPDRIVLSWVGDPSSSQSVTWRTDVSVQTPQAQIALAEDNGNELKPQAFSAETTPFSSEMGGNVLYHSVNFTDLLPQTLYAYRIGDGSTWTEWFHFRTASKEAKPFSFIYFGDAQANIKENWSRVSHEAFKNAPQAAFTLHAGDQINRAENDEQWGEWFSAPGWVNATVPMIAVPGNHEYFYEGRGEKEDRKWTLKDGSTLQVRTSEEITRDPAGNETGLVITARTVDGSTGKITLDAKDRIIRVDKGIQKMTGYTEKELRGYKPNASALDDRYAEPGNPRLTSFWRPQFSFPENGPKKVVETCYYIDYQGARIIALNTNEQLEEQVEWLKMVLSDNPQRWTILVFHHPVFSPTIGRDNPELRALLKPVLERFRVDLVLTGHDHTYARTDSEGTTYIVSVSGPKLYHVDLQDWMKKAGEYVQLYQVIHVGSGEIRYESRTATGKLYDSCTIRKREGQQNQIIESLPSEYIEK